MQNFISSGAVMSVGEGRLLVGFGNPKWESLPTPKKGAFYFPDFFLKSSYPWLHFEVTFEISVSSLLEELEALSGKPFSGEFSKLDESVFSEEFEAVQRSGLKKVVPYLTRASKESFSQENLIHSLKKLLSQRGFLYGFWDEGKGLLGVTPELLYKAEEGVLETVALAGTKGAHSSDEEFFNDPKERNEHGLVIQGIEDSLGEVEIAETTLLRAGTLTHLQTKIRKELGSTDPLSLIKKLHPTPALGGFPKDQAFTYLKDYAKRHPRGRFGAPVGFVKGAGSEMSFYVAIRGIQWREEGTFVTAGCGVVKESQCENEFKEIDRKINSIFKMFGLDHVLA